MRRELTPLAAAASIVTLSRTYSLQDLARDTRRLASMIRHLFLGSTMESIAGEVGIRNLMPFVAAMCPFVDHPAAALILYHLHFEGELLRLFLSASSSERRLSNNFDRIGEADAVQAYSNLNGRNAVDVRIWIGVDLPNWLDECADDMLRRNPVAPSPPDAGSPGGDQTEQSDSANFSYAMARYARSCDELSTLRIHPAKAMPFDQCPEETQVRAGVITRDRDVKKYVRYLLGVAADNEMLAEQARQWWNWWEATRAGKSDAGPEPLVSQRIGAALRTAAARREAESTAFTRREAEPTAYAAKAKAKRMAKTPGSSSRPSPDAIDATAKRILMDALQASNDAGKPFVPDRAAIAKTVGKALNISICVETLFGKRSKNGQRVYRYPDFMKLWRATKMASSERRRAGFSKRSTLA